MTSMCEKMLILIFFSSTIRIVKKLDAVMIIIRIIHSGMQFLCRLYVHTSFYVHIYIYIHTYIYTQYIYIFYIYTYI